MLLNWPQFQTLLSILSQMPNALENLLTGPWTVCQKSNDLCAETLKLILCGSWNKFCCREQTNKPIWSSLVSYHLFGQGMLKEGEELLCLCYSAHPSHSCQSPDLFASFHFTILLLFFFNVLHLLALRCARLECGPNPLQVFCQVSPCVPLYQGASWHLSVFLQHTRSSCQIWYSWQGATIGKKERMKLNNKPTSNQQIPKRSQPARLQQHEKEKLYL